MTARLDAQFAFLMEADKLKQILRATTLADGSRRENSGEHSWHLALYALVLADHAAPGVSIDRVIRMLILHDLVEIDVGDVPIHSQNGAAHGSAETAAAEARAADRLFGLLPGDLGVELRALWEEFEAAETPDAVFAKSLDRVQPVLHNIASGGDGVDGPQRHSMCQNEVVVDLKQRRPSLEHVCRIGMDTSKRIFQLHGVNEAEEPILRKKLRRSDMIAFFNKLSPTVIAIEACGASHHWARLLGSFGHEVKLIAPQLVKPYVKRGKNDAADAEALCEAMSRPAMRFVPVKTVDQQAALMLMGLRDRMIRNRTQLANSIRGYGAEFGLTIATGMVHIPKLLSRIQSDESLPALARDLFAAQAEEYHQLQQRIDDVEARLRAWHKTDACSRRLAKIPGIGPVGAAMLILKTPAPEAFRSGRQFAAWIGLTPKDHSTAGRVRLGSITRAGDESLRSVLVVGATAVIRQLRMRRGNAFPWLANLLKRKPPKLAAVALANKMARIAWKLMVSGEAYAPRTAALPNAAA